MTGRPCKCGCGTLVVDSAHRGREYVNPAHRTRGYRARRQTDRVTSQRRGEWAPDIVAALYQTQRILRLGELRGSYGFTQIDFDIPTADGGEPIKRVAARVHELEQLGETIGRGGRRQRCIVYRLQTQPAALAEAA